MSKIVLAYSGGLDTSVIIAWLREEYGYEVITMSADLGQKQDMEALRKKAYESGASKVYIEDLKEEFLTDYVFPTLRAGAIYENRYLLGTSFARPLIGKRLAEIAEKENAEAVAHGATAKGNDQVRFELAVKAFNPKLKIIAPWREWDISSRQEAIEYAEKRGIPVPVTKDKPFSRDENLWHLSHEGGVLENPWYEHNKDMYQLVTPPEDAPENAAFIEVDFEEGIPIAVNGRRLPPVELMEEVNELAAQHGVGIVDIVENRLVGIKSRGVYETPGGTVLYCAHEALESITMDRETSHFKKLVSEKYAEIVYDGLWYSQLREALDGFVASTQEMVTGKVKMKLYKGNCSPVAIKSPYSLYSEGLATFENDNIFHHEDAEGFINLFGLPLTVRALMLKRNKLKK